MEQSGPFSSSNTSLKKRQALPANFSWTHEEMIQLIDANMSDELKAELNTLNAHNISTYLYGGALRDLLLGGSENDKDFILFSTKETELEILSGLQSTYRKISKTVASYETKIAGQVVQLHIETLNKNSEDKLILQKAFEIKVPINAIFYQYHPDPNKKRILDSFNGISAAKERKLDVLANYSAEELTEDISLLFKLIKIMAKYSQINVSDKIKLALKESHHFIAANPKRFKMTKEILATIDYHYGYFDRLLELLNKYHYLNEIFLCSKLNIKNIFNDIAKLKQQTRLFPEIFSNKRQIYIYFFAMVLWPVFSTFYDFHKRKNSNNSEPHYKVIEKIANVVVTAQKTTLFIHNDTAKFFTLLALHMKLGSDEKSELFTYLSQADVQLYQDNLFLFANCQTLIGELLSFETDKALATNEKYIADLFNSYSESESAPPPHQIEDCNNNAASISAPTIATIPDVKSSKNEATVPPPEGKVSKPWRDEPDYRRLGNPLKRLLSSKPSTKVKSLSLPVTKEEIVTSIPVSVEYPPEPSRQDVSPIDEFIPGPSQGSSVMSEASFPHENIKTKETIEQKKPSLNNNEKNHVKPQKAATETTLKRQHTAGRNNATANEENNLVAFLQRAAFFLTMFSFHKSFQPPTESFIEEASQNLFVSTQILVGMFFLQMGYDAYMKRDNPYVTRSVAAIDNSYDAIKSLFIKKAQKNIIEIIEEETPGIEILDNSNLQKFLEPQTNSKPNKIFEHGAKIEFLKPRSEIKQNLSLIKANPTKAAKGDNSKKKSTPLHRSSPLRKTSRKATVNLQDNDKAFQKSDFNLAAGLGMLAFVCMFRACTGDDDFWENLGEDAPIALIAGLLLVVMKFAYETLVDLRQNNSNENMVVSNRP